MLRTARLSLVLSLLGAAACAAPAADAPPPASPEAAPAESKSATPSASAAPAKDAAPSAPPAELDITPKDLGTIKGKPALFKHAYLFTLDGDLQLQAFTADQAAKVCPNGLRFAAEGELLQVNFGSKAPETKDTSRFQLQTQNGDVKVAKGSAKVVGTPTPGSKVSVELAVEGAPNSKLNGVIEAVVCQPPKKD